jgi:hypothetical protein
MQASDLGKRRYTMDMRADLRFFPTLGRPDIRALMSSLSPENQRGRA